MECILNTGLGQTSLPLKDSHRGFWALQQEMSVGTRARWWHRAVLDVLDDQDVSSGLGVRFCTPVALV